MRSPCEDRGFCYKKKPYASLRLMYFFEDRLQRSQRTHRRLSLCHARARAFAPFDHTAGQVKKKNPSPQIHEKIQKCNLDLKYIL